MERKLLHMCTAHNHQAEECSVAAGAAHRMKHNARARPNTTSVSAISQCEKRTSVVYSFLYAHTHTHTRIRYIYIYIQKDMANFVLLHFRRKLIAIRTKLYGWRCAAHGIAAHTKETPRRRTKCFFLQSYAVYMLHMQHIHMYIFSVCSTQSSCINSKLYPINNKMLVQVFVI